MIGKRIILTAGNSVATLIESGTVVTGFDVPVLVDLRAVEREPILEPIPDIPLRQKPRRDWEQRQRKRRR